MHKIGHFPGTHARNNVLTFLQEVLRHRPTHPLLIWMNPQSQKHEQWSAQEFYQRIMRLAQGFKDQGIKAGDTALVFLPMSAPMYCSMFALQALGAIPVFLDSWARRDDVGPALEIAQCKAVCSSAQGLTWIRSLQESAGVEQFYRFGPGTDDSSISLEALMASDMLAELTAVQSEHTALVTFTTGSTGRPKGADRSHRFLADQHSALLAHLPYRETDVDLPLFPVFSLNSLASGVPTVLPAVDLAAPHPDDALRIAMQIADQGVSCTTLSPVLFRQIPKAIQSTASTHLLRGLRRIITGGAPISKQEIQAWMDLDPQIQVEVLYGSTEVEPMAHLRGEDLLQRQDRSQIDPLWVEDGVWIGPMDSGLNWALVPVDLDPHTAAQKLALDPNYYQKDQGELWVAGSHVCPRYYNDPEASDRAKIKDAQGTLWHRTGDVLRMESDRSLWMIGRLPQRVRSQKGDLYPVRTEMIARKRKGIHTAALLEMPGPKATLVIQASNPEACQAEIQEIESELQMALNHNGIQVDQILFRNDIPLDPRHHSKVEYGKLREMLLQESAP